MATTTETDEERRGLTGERAREAFESMRVAITGSPFVRLRMLVLLMLAAACVAVAPFPWNVVGVMAMGLIAFEIGRMK